MAPHSSAAANGTTTAVDVDRDNFQAVLPSVEKALNECTFFAIDCEMTGLFLDGSKEEFLDDMNDRYARLRESAQSYMVNQVGVSCFKYVPQGAKGPRGEEGPGYVASTFNFYVFPEPLKDSSQPTRKFLSDSGSLSFLASQNFDFNKWVYKGIPVMAAKERQKQIKEVQKYYNNNEARTPVVPTKPDDIALVQRVVQQVTEWLAGSQPTLQLQEMNGYQRLLAFQELRKPQFGVEDHPGFFVKKIATSNGYAILELVRGTKEEVKAMEEEDVRQRMQAIDDASGFTRVLEAVRRSNRPAVGHNCWFDVGYVLTACVEPTLPGTWGEYKRLVAEWFPGGVFDTKYLSRQLPQVFDNWTGLSDVYKAVAEEGDKRQRAVSLLAEGAMKLPPGSGAYALPWVAHAPGFEKYEQVEAGGLAHEAGYDAYMTGAAFTSLVPLTQARDAAAAAAAAGAAVTKAAASVTGAATAGAVTGGADPMDVDGNGGGGSADDDSDGGAPHLVPSESLQQAVQGVAAAVQGMAVASPGPGGGGAKTVVAAAVAAVAGDPAAGVEGARKSDDPLESVRQYNGRLNIVRSDMPYAALIGADPVLNRPQVFYITGLPSNPRAAVEDVQRRFLDAGLGKPRVTLLWPDRNNGGNNGNNGNSGGTDANAPSALVEVDASAASRVLSALSIAPWPASSPPAAVPAVTTRLTAPTAPSAGEAVPRVVVCPWTDYAAARSAASDRAVAARAAAAAASNGRPAKRSRVEAEAGAQAGAEEARPEERPWCSIM